MERALLLLGGNVGEVAATLQRAIGLLEHRAGVVEARSRVHRTAPWGGIAQPLFLNQAVVVRTALEPSALLSVCLQVEQELGRVRGSEVRYGPRTIDIDILLLGARVVQLPQLHVPHPRMHERRFALAPAADVAPLWRHPLLGRTVLEWLDVAAANETG